jgi:hypothetical protein
MLRSELMVSARDGDVFLERSYSWLGRAIRWFIGSEKNHTGIVFIMTPERRDLLTKYGLKIPEAWIGEPCVVEAMIRVRVRLLKDRLSESSDISISRNETLTKAAQHSVVNAALEFVGQIYGFLRLLRHGLDIITNTKGVRKMAADIMICSYLVAFAYAVVEIFFGVTARECTPEDIAHTIKTDPNWTEYFSEKAKGGSHE